MSEDAVTVQCPYCGESQELVLEADVDGQMIIDCQVCCRPWHVNVSHDVDGDVAVVVERAD